MVNCFIFYNTILYVFALKYFILHVGINKQEPKYVFEISAESERSFSADVTPVHKPYPTGKDSNFIFTAIIYVKQIGLI